MTHVADETKLNKFFRFLHGVSERAFKGSIDIEQFTTVAQVLLDKGARAKNLLEYVTKGCPSIDYAQSVPKTKEVHSATIIDLDATPFTPSGWRVEEHRKGGQFNFDPSQVKLCLDVGQQNGKSIKGIELRKNLKNVPVMNANLLDWYLQNPQHIPKEWRGEYVFFWGTVYRDNIGYLYIRYLCWNGVRWDWTALWMEACWHEGNPALVRVI